ncbi:ATP-binding cassette domain-containing protein [Dyella sp. BiH032]|uniref:ATP-binding cassette domain-containing protein n=1 Tax=Dyella sp. BiH032 TaxID=3075430 RepID=UPI002893661D|nr:ATP-binding cassette domain-containing protein [Dyella sp. BiH032]WNL44308.1 ATP-binding cassette domain-containing protein [Dyella sp. BiH032]
MMESLLTLQRAAFAWPDGRRLFSDLDVQLDRRHTGLVGRNGVGKSVLAQLLAGQLEPTEGRCQRMGSVHYVPQLVSCPPGATVASVLGVRAALDALDRIEAGSVDAADFDAVAERWNLRQRVAELLQEHGLGDLAPEQSATTLSGGELTRLALLGGWMAEPDVLILDEPTNHLDRTQRELLLRTVRAWSKGLLVVSHDRELLSDMQRIIELSPTGLRDYGGGYAFYAQARAQEQERALQELEHSKAERRRAEAEARAKQESLQRRQARSTREGKEANQAAILLGGRKQNSQVSAGKRLIELDAQRETLAQRVREAARQVREDADIALLAPRTTAAGQRKAATLEGVRLPYGTAAGHPLDLIVLGRQRVGVTGANGGGKSILLKVLAGLERPVEGRCDVHVRAALLDQQLDLLDPDASALEQLLSAHTAAGESDMRTRLALLGLAGDAALKPSARLSGGERLKVALACVMYAEHPAELLLLDEPTNHLDLRSVEAVEEMLRQYRGALVVVSHDQVFLDGLMLDLRLEAGSDGWRLTGMGEVA